jgi:hypothetical protein
MIGLIAIFIGLPVVIYGFYLMSVATKIQKWPCIAGKVDLSAYEEMGEGACDLRISYSYTINGQTFTGTRVAMGHTHFSQKEAQRLASKYSPKTAVQVRYDPEHPEQCFLEMIKPRDAWPLIAVGGVFIAAGVLAMVTKSQGH